MINTLKAEIRKLLSVRSTYAILAFCLALTIFFAFYAKGIKLSDPELLKPDTFRDEVTIIISILSLLLMLPGVLLVSYEYRYNTILYTLSAAHRRTQVLVSKFLVISVFVLFWTAVFMALTPLFSWLGVQASGRDLVSQDMVPWSVIGRALFASWGTAMLAFVIAILARSQVVAIAAALLMPSTIEPLLGLVLKSNQVYLPFMSVSAALADMSISHTKAIAVGTAWIVGTGILAWVWFVRRDAN